MFKFFKKKVKDTISNLTKKIEEPEEQEQQEIKQEEVKETQEEKPKEKKRFGFFGKITTTEISEKKFEDIFWDLEVVLLENNTAVEVIDKIKQDLKKELLNNPIKRGKTEEIIINTLKKSIEEALIDKKIDLVQEIKNKQEKPYVIALIGINGSGKTTSIAKIVHLLKNAGIEPVVAASDTFRAAAIDQLQEHTDKLGVKLIKQNYGADPAAVAFDAIKYAKAKNSEAVLIDTAGRLHSNKNLIEEMKKIIKISKPDLKIFVGESITGNDCIEQAKQFDEAVGIDGIILSKVDVDEKGGTAISVSYITKKPIIYIGTGQEYKDFEQFNKNKILESIGL